MGLAELHSKIVVEMKYDVGDARAALRSLSGDEKKLAEERLKAAEAHNKSIDKQIRNIQRIGTGMQIAQVAARASGVDIADITNSFKDLTGIPLGGAGTAIGFMLGGPAGAALGTLAEAALTSKNNFSEMFIAVQEASGGTTTGLRDMADGAHYAGQNIFTLSDHFAIFTANIRAAHDELTALAGMRGAFATAAKVVEDAKDQIAEYNRVAELTGEGGTKRYYTAVEELNRQHDLGLISQTLFERGIEKLNKGHEGAVTKIKKHKDELREWRDLLASTGERPNFADTNSRAWAREQAERERETAARDRSEASEWSRAPMLGERDTTEADTERALNAQVRAQVMAAESAKQALASVSGPTLTDRVFGSIEELVSRQDAWAAVTGSMTAGYDAMVDGTGQVGKKMKQAAADSIKAIGQTMLIKGLEQSAHAIAAAATFNWPSAAAHALSAGKFFAGAAIAGVAANGIGTSAGVAAGEARAAQVERDKPKAPSVSGGATGSDRTRTERIIVYSDAFAEDSARGKQLQADRIVARALGNSAVRNN